MQYSESLIWRVWSRAEIFAGNDPVFWRKDFCGAWIFRGDYNNPDSEYGWVISHIKPLDKGGTDDFSNLYPLHWHNTDRNLDGSIICKTTAAGIHNNADMETNNSNAQVSTVKE